jgi:hypothetical protein
MHGAIAALSDAERSRSNACQQAQAQWSDMAQRAFWDRVLLELDREARQYDHALNELDRQLARALSLLDD